MGVLKEVNLVGAYLQPPEHMTVTTGAESEMNDYRAAAGHKPLKMLRTQDSIFVMVFSHRRRQPAHSQIALPENVAVLREM